MLSDAQLDAMASDLAGIAGVVGVALGGSRARGDATPESDVDVGVYYGSQLDLAALERVARSWGGPAVTVAGPGGWGPWVDGGAWLEVGGTPVDWILRDLSRVRDQAERARAGHYSFHAQPGHPLGFLDIAYAGELAQARLLADATGALTQLRDQLIPYPAALADAFAAGLWEAEFTLGAAAKGAGRGDVTYVGLCVARALLLAAHALMAASGQWVTNEKGLIAAAGRLPLAPPRFADDAARLAGHLGTSPGDLRSTLVRARTWVDAVSAACAEPGA